MHEGYGEADIPEYWAFARQFTLCDRYFTDVAGPSTPNHLMVIAADSPLIDNYHHNDPSQPVPPYKLPSLPAALAKAGHTWGNYGGFAFDLITSLQGSPNNLKADQFATDAAAGRLPNVSWVFGPAGMDEHPVSSVAAGSKWTAQQMAAIVAGGLWPKTAIFMTWDDWGGWSDHVDPPPSLEPWNDGFQFRLGNRVPCIVVSPFAKSAYISHVQHSHVSLVRFVEDTFGLPPINRRDASANGMADCFDFSRTPAPPPTIGKPAPRPRPGRKPASVVPDPPPPPAPPTGPNPTGLRFVLVAGTEPGMPFSYELRSHDDHVIARSEGFASKAACRMSIDFLQRGVETAEFVDDTELTTKTAVAKKAVANTPARSGARSTKART